MSEISVRDFVPADHDLVLALWRQYISETFRDNFGGEDLDAARSLDRWGPGIAVPLDATPEELHALPEEPSLAVDSYLRQTVSSPAAGCLVAARRRKLVGFCVFEVRTHPFLTGALGVVTDVYVRPERRRRGVATGLVHAARSQMRAQGAAVFRAYVSTAPSFDDAVAFWKGIGWIEDLRVLSSYD